MPDLDPVDMRLLRALEHDARLSFASLGEVAGVSKTPSWKRVQAMEKAGVIAGYRAVIDPAGIGLSTSAFVQVSIEFDRHEAFESAVQDEPAVLACHATVGDFDYLLQVATAGVPELDDLLRNRLRRLPGVRHFTTTLAMRDVKPRAYLTDAAKG
ncbi:AsnC family transcriptional regulator [Novosphingobium sp. PhB165]|uniref:Lrp/AsnC family transcriptional regulator n=1 Tax=Novosphingobium sp. PhB165 TaxID=2485105 RepID=UPI0010539343|nr:Lrp/AsnC family transcriptional regulator [Novosphingobium sp. PhB165]TCM21677.1 AsnC family transcriptional regulator [Novosphingobium sp. PhB165]